VDDVDAGAHRLEGGCFGALPLQADDVQALLLQRLQVAQLVGDAEVGDEPRLVADPLGRGLQPAVGDREVERGEVVALLVPGQVAGAEDQPPVDAVHGSALDRADGGGQG
jgi:hypothetical protein